MAMYDGIDYFVVWDGSLGPPSPVAVDTPVLKDNRHYFVSRTSHAEARQLLMSLLSERRAWKTKTLRAKSGLDETTFWACVQWMKRRQIVSSPEHGVLVADRASI